MDPLTQAEEDVLADVLQSIHLRSTLYCRARLGAPWGIGVPRREEVAVFHIVTEGACWLTVQGTDQPVACRAGDLIILPHGHAHTVTDQPATPAAAFEDFVAWYPPDEHGLVYGGGQGAVSTLVCGEFRLEASPSSPLHSLLPIYLRAGGQQRRANPWVRAILPLVRAEARGHQPGAETVITRLSEILFIQSVREYLHTVDDAGVGWLKALRDPQIGQVLASIHRQPEQHWTVDALARRVGLSRSALAAKFTRLVGRPPLHYLAEVRLTKAAALLRTQPATLLEVARSVGYESEVALSKAFKRRFGVAPGAYRRGGRPVEVTS
jgi:AraC-like DNA-binding protein